MKNIFLALSFILLGLTQVAGAKIVDPQWAAFEEQQGTESRAFWAGQAAERDAWGKAHKDVMDKFNVYGKALVDYKERKRQSSLGHGAPLITGGEPTAPLPDSQYEAFKTKQRTDKEIFLQKMDQEKQNFLSTHPGVTPT